MCRGPRVAQRLLCASWNNNNRFVVNVVGGRATDVASSRSVVVVDDDVDDLSGNLAAMAYCE